MNETDRRDVLRNAGLAVMAALAEGVLGQHQARSIVELCWRIDELADSGEIARTAGKS